MQISNVPTEAADSDESRLQHSTLCREQHEFARVFGALLAEKWRQVHSVQRADSTLENQNEAS